MAEDKKLNPEELENVAGGEYFETMEEAVFHANGVGICPYCGKNLDKKCPKCGEPYKNSGGRGLIQCEKCGNIFLPT